MGELLFCPFCREAFEDEVQCPEHELDLVPWLALPSARGVPQGDGPLAWYSPRLGRGLLAAGAVATFVAFLLLDLASVTGEVSMGGRMLALATSGSAPRLWLLPAAAGAQLAILARRRSASEMRGARLVALLLSILPAAVVAWSLLGVEDAVGLLAERTGRELPLRLGAGAWVVWLSALPMIAGSLRLGVEPGDR